MEESWGITSEAFQETPYMNEEYTYVWLVISILLVIVWVQIELKLPNFLRCYYWY